MEQKWRRKWQPTPLFLPGESQGQSRLVGCSPRGRRESDTPERLQWNRAALCPLVPEPSRTASHRAAGERLFSMNVELWLQGSLPMWVCGQWVHITVISKMRGGIAMLSLVNC